MKAQSISESNARHKLDHPKKDEIVNAILNKEKEAWIEAQFKCASSTISRYRRELGIPLPTPKLTADQRNEIIELRKQKKLTELAAMFNVCPQRISQICRKKK